MKLRDHLKPSTAVLLALLVVCSSAASVTALAGTAATAPAAPAASGPADQAMTVDADNESVEPADEIFVKENGDAVLVYDQSQDSETSASTATGHLGLNVSQGLMHVLVRDEISEGTNVTGDAQFVLTPSAFTGNGSFQAPRPETLDSLDASATAERTESSMSASASLDMTYTSENEYSTTSQIESATTEGSMSVNADSFSTSGSANVEMSQNLGVLQQREYTLEEGADQYRLQASEEYYVSSYVADQWDTREKAKATLESQYASIARALGGSAQVTIQSYDYTEASSGQNVLDIEYQIVYSNIDDALAQQVSRSIANAEDVDVSQETANAVGDGVAELNVDRVHASLDAEGSTVDASWDVQMSNYDALVSAGLDLAEETSEDANVTEQIQRARKSYEAAQAADLTQTMTWDGSLSSPSQQTVQVSATMNYETENYEAYLSELESRDVPTGGTYSFEANAKTQGEQVVADMKVSVEQENLVDQTLDSFMQSASQSNTGSESAQRFIKAFESSEFEKAKMNVDVSENEVTFQAGANFENMESFRSVMQDQFGGDVASMYASVEDGSKAYVHVDGAFDSGVSESDVRAHAAVDSETTVHMPGDWDAASKEFPSMDQDAARDYLGLEDPSSTTTTSSDDNTSTDDGTSESSATTSGDSGGLPGFGVPAAFAAVAAVSALLLGRLNRRDD